MVSASFVNNAYVSVIIFLPIQVISNLSATTGPLFYMESWGRFPKERDWLFKLIADSKVVYVCSMMHIFNYTSFSSDF